MANLEEEKGGAGFAPFDSHTKPHFWSLFISVLLCLAGVYIFVGALTGRTPPMHWHNALFLGMMVALVLLMQPAGKKPASDEDLGNIPHRPSALDIGLAIVGVLACLWIGISYRGFHMFGLDLPALAFRLGNPAMPDLVMGTALLVVLFEATRRAVGIVFPIIMGVFTLYMLFGQSVPIAILQHPGATWSQFINQMTMSSEGVFGGTLGVISTVVLVFVLFGEFAQRVGLGKLFMELAACVAGRFAGGPAKVSVVSSAMFGMISGSTVANTVATGSMTIPAMKRAGYPAYFAGAVEAASSAGGQITPPLMGAAAFLMVEFLHLPYTTIIIAAALPAAMHYLGLLGAVHFRAKRLGLEGMPREELPRVKTVLKEGWPAIAPLAVLLVLLFNHFTPQYAAAWGILSCIVIGVVHPRRMIPLREIPVIFATGVRHALAVGVIAGAVGVVIGVITMTGVSFRLGFLVTGMATSVSDALQPLFNMIPLLEITPQSLSIFFSLVFIGVANILMGAGIPTTALYIMLAPIATPALANLGVPPLAAHMFVLYYGVLADITPPVCVSAFAAAGIAGSPPLKTGTQAFLLGIGKIVVPFVFVYAPSFLLVTEDFNWTEFVPAFLSASIGILIFSMAVGGFALTRLGWVSRVWLGIAGLIATAPNYPSLWVGLAMTALVFATGYVRRNRTSVAV
jgi:TRAP transporter 4TM/12TM fusion protein